MKEENQLSHREIKPSTERMKPHPIILLLDQLTDLSNIGSMFRLADAANIEGIYGYKTGVEMTAKKIDAVSRQTFQRIPFKEINDFWEIKELTKTYYPIALKYTNKSIPFSEYIHAIPSILIVGNEQQGVSEELLTLNKASLHVSMYGRNSSMNVTVATGIVLYHLISL